MDPIHRTSGDLKITGRVIWLLRIAVALQAVGVSFKFLLAEFEVDSPIRSVLFYEWEWSEQLAQRVDDFGAMGYGVCGLFVLLGPAVATLLKVDVRRALGWIAIEGTLLAYLAASEVCVALATWHRDEAFMSSWVPIEQWPQFSIPLVFVSRASRMLLPVALILLIRPQVDRDASTRQLVVGMWVLRIAASLTFAGHGVRCLFFYNVFVDYLLAGAHNLFGWDAAELTMKTFLQIIGVVDLVMASLILLQRWRFVAMYMAVWAFIGAWSRVVHAGWIAHFEVTIRSANYCIPLAIYLYFRWRLKPEARPAATPQSISHLQAEDENSEPSL